MTPWSDDILWPGVLGYTIDSNGSLYLPAIMAFNPGHGDVGWYLDSLPIDRPIVVPNVMSARLAGMLYRRGFRPGWEWAEQFEEWMPSFFREPL